MSSTNVSEFNPILSDIRTPEGMKQRRLEDARQQLLQAEDVKKPTRLESMEDNQIDIHNVIDEHTSEVEQQRRDEVEKQRRKEDERFYETTTIGGNKCSEFQKGNVPNTQVLPEPMFINGIRQGPDAGIQCVIFDKTYYNDEKAREWLRYNGFKTNYEPMILCNPHITEDYFSYMQFDVQPKHLQRDIFTSITPKEGIELLIYCKK